jgi:hypothetical protein
MYLFRNDIVLFLLFFVRSKSFNDELLDIVFNHLFQIVSSIFNMNSPISNGATMSDHTHAKHYKHRGLDSEELRKRREDRTITLRKQKRDEQVC